LPVCPVQSTPAGPRAPDRYGAAAWPLVCVKQRLPRKVFRRSIPWLSDSRPTLRRLGYPIRRKTRFQPLVRRYWTGFYLQGFNERFLSASYISSSFPELCLAQTHRPRHCRAGGDGDTREGDDAVERTPRTPSPGEDRRRSRCFLSSPEGESVRDLVRNGDGYREQYLRLRGATA
jgi:hypothetical protein